MAEEQGWEDREGCGKEGRTRRVSQSLPDVHMEVSASHQPQSLSSPGFHPAFTRLSPGSPSASQTRNPNPPIYNQTAASPTCSWACSLSEFGVASSVSCASFSEDLAAVP